MFVSINNGLELREREPSFLGDLVLDECVLGDLDSPRDLGERDSNLGERGDLEPLDRGRGDLESLILGPGDLESLDLGKGDLESLSLLRGDLIGLRLGDLIGLRLGDLIIRSGLGDLL